MRTSGARARKGGSGKNTYGIYRLFGRLRRNVGGTNQVADRVIGHQRSCEYHAVCVIFTKTKMHSTHINVHKPELAILYLSLSEGDLVTSL